MTELDSATRNGIARWRGAVPTLSRERLYVIYTRASGGCSVYISMVSWVNGQVRRNDLTRIVATSRSLLSCWSILRAIYSWCDCVSLCVSDTYERLLYIVNCDDANALEWINRAHFRLLLNSWNISFVLYNTHQYNISDWNSLFFIASSIKFYYFLITHCCARSRSIEKWFVFSMFIIRNFIRADIVKREENV